MAPASLAGRSCQQLLLRACQQRSPARLFSSAEPPSSISSSSSSSGAAAAPLGQQWEARRLSWLATGRFESISASASAALAAALASARSEQAELRAKKAPVRIRERNILAALRDPLREVEFNRPMPLASLVNICGQLWEEEALLSASAPLPKR